MLKQRTQTPEMSPASLRPLTRRELSKRASRAWCTSTACWHLSSVRFFQPVIVKGTVAKRFVAICEVNILLSTNQPLLVVAREVCLPNSVVPRFATNEKRVYLLASVRPA